MNVFKTFTIEAARSLPNLPDGHPCKNIHGHSFKITITVTGNVDNKTGFVMDFGDIDETFNPLLSKLDHSYLNDIEGLENPSSENVCQWIWERLAPSLPGLSQIDIKETDSTGCIYKGE
ncbi:MAG TPA: 6-carboxytetrahydropterin synthase QueD [Candidatus Marinimicrobia bacterium]|jgi:6-pyruvoyltetrahydropterin/6-carboxytetrahydropterin synthase|nr:6-carboxytetrahydropterin synthase QueD [Candidatus Neomarinimicrobiota bacterium]HIB31744.1 6-carboxytetrahydropterin synthase QueD [Candidatus Neomarinimicrobiota bacterium]